MATKDEWKDTGKELGDAFKGLAASLIRSAKVGVEKAEEWAEAQKSEGTERSEGEAQSASAETCAQENAESNVFNDGSWRETGKQLGSAFKSLSATLINTVEEGADKAEEWADANSARAEEAARNAAAKAEEAAEDIRKGAADFAEGLRESDAAGEVVAEAEVISEEIVDQADQDAAAE